MSKLPSTSSVVTGTIIYAPYNPDATNYLPCDGSQYLRSSYATLAAMLPNPSRTFNNSTITNPPSAGNAIANFDFCPNGFGLAWLSGTSKLWKTTDYGTTWADVTANIPTVQGTGDYYLFAIPGNQIMIARTGTNAAGNWAYYTSNGTSWTNISTFTTNSSNNNSYWTAGPWSTSGNYRSIQVLPTSYYYAAYSVNSSGTFTSIATSSNASSSLTVMPLPSDHYAVYHQSWTGSYYQKYIYYGGFAAGGIGSDQIATSLTPLGWTNNSSSSQWGLGGSYKTMPDGTFLYATSNNSYACICRNLAGPSVAGDWSATTLYNNVPPNYTLTYSNMIFLDGGAYVSQGGSQPIFWIPATNSPVVNTTTNYYPRYDRNPFDCKFDGSQTSPRFYRIAVGQSDRFMRIDPDQPNSTYFYTPVVNPQSLATNQAGQQFVAPYNYQWPGALKAYIKT